MQNAAQNIQNQSRSQRNNPTPNFQNMFNNLFQNNNTRNAQTPPQRRKSQPYSFTKKPNSTPNFAPNQNKEPPVDKKMREAEIMNQKAKVFFQNKQYVNAIQVYKNAFELFQNVKYVTNIAKCYNKMGQYQEAEKSISIGLQFSPNDDNLHRLGGIFAYKQYSCYDTKSMLFKASDYFFNAFDINPSEVNTMNYLVVRKAIFLYKEEERMFEKLELLHYIENKTSYESEEINLFCRKGFHEEKKEYPEFLNCSITLEIIKDPVTTPCGYSYERKDLVEWCTKSGFKDIMTGRDFTSKEKLAENKMLKKFIREFLIKNQWAIDTPDSGNDWKMYEFK